MILWIALALVALLMLALIYEAPNMTKWIMAYDMY